MRLWTEAGSVPGLDVRLLSWAVEYLVFEYLASWHPRKQSPDIPCQDGNGNLIRITKLPALRCCQCSDTVIAEEKPNSESDLQRDPSPVLASSHEEPSLVEQYLLTNNHKIDGRVFSDPTSDQVYHELPTRESCRLVNIHDPLFVLLILLYNTYQYFDLTLLLPLPPSVKIIGVSASFFFQPYWLLVILLDNDKGCRRRRWIAACSIVWIDDAFWRTLSGTLFAFALPELDSGRLRALLTLPNLAIQYPYSEVIEAPDGQGQTAPPSGGLPHTGRNNKNQSQPQSNRERGKPARGRGQKRRGPGRGGAGRGGGDGDDNEQQESEDKSAEKKLACHYFKRWPWLHMGCFFHSQIASRYVKIHLLRKHRQPIHCPTCFTTFTTHADQTTHISARTCQPGEGTCPYHGTAISNDQRDALNNHPVPPGADEKEKWFLMWDILFPDIPRPSSPYVTAQEGEGLFRSFAEFATSQYSLRLNQSDRFNAEDTRHALDILAEVFEGDIGTQALSRAVVTPAPPSNHLPPPPTPRQRHHPTPSEVIDARITGLSPSPIPATETGAFDTPMPYPATFGSLPLDHLSNPRFSHRTNMQYENQHALSPTPATTRSSLVEEHRAHRRRGRERTRINNNVMSGSTPSNTTSMSQHMFSNQYPLTPPGGYAPSPPIHISSIATLPYFQTLYHRQQYPTPYFNPYQPNTPQGYPTNMGHEQSPTAYPESLMNRAHGLSPPPFLYGGLDNQNNQMQSQTGFPHQGHSHRQTGNEQRRTQHNEGPGTTPGQNMVGAMGFQAFSHPGSLSRLHMTGASAHIPESASAGPVPEEMETDYQLGAAQNEMSDNSQSGSPSDVFRDLNYSSEPGGG